MKYTLRQGKEFSYLAPEKKDYSWVAGAWLMGLLVIAIWLSIK